MTDVNIFTRLEAVFNNVQVSMGEYRHNDSILSEVEEYDLAHIKAYLEKIPKQAEAIQLPSLIGTDKPLPIASMYVELAINRVAANPIPEVLQQSDSLSEALRKRSEHRRARRLPIEQALSSCRERTIVILGDPGSGKTSLLKRITLDIAQGRWENWCIPIYIPLRLYWEARSRFNDQALTLSRYAATQIISAAVGLHPAEQDRFDSHSHQEFRHEIDLLEKFLVILSGSGRRNVIFLLDGFDEISNDAKAMNIVPHEIQRLSKAFSWILTSRRAGLFDGLDEDIQYEVVDLDDDGIETLIKNWFRHQAGHRPDRSNEILDQIFANDRLLSMARNPFLLTLLCHLQSASGRSLPLHRTDVYEHLINRVVEQTRHSRGHQDILRSADRQFLSRFCYALYTDQMRMPRHLFSLDDWQNFECNLPRPDLERQIRPSRLLDKWSIDSGYHLIHLTFHEYFVALAMLEHPVEDAIQKIYLPHWRVILRFYGGMLWRKGRDREFATLLKATLDPIDVMGMMYIEAAGLFAETGLTDSRAILGFDLADRLWSIWQENRPAVADAAGDALAILAPDDVLKHCRQIIESSLDDLTSGMEEAKRAIRLLGKLRQPAARDLLFQVLENGPPHMISSVPAAIAHHCGRPVRKRLISLIQSVPMNAILFPRLCQTAGEARHNDFIAPLVHRLESATTGQATPILRALTQIGGTAIATPVLDWLIQQEGASFPHLDAHNALMASGAPEADVYFRNLQHSHDPLLAREGMWGCLDTSANSLPYLRRLMQTDDLRLQKDVLLLIADKAENGWAAPDGATHMIRPLLAHSITCFAAARALSMIEVQRAQRGRDAPNRILLRQLLTKPPASQDQDHRPFVVQALGILEDHPSFLRMLTLLDDENISVALCCACIRSLGQLGKPRDVLLDRLLPFLHSADRMVVAQAADAIAKIDFMALKLHWHHPLIKDALARFASEQGYLLFEEFTVNPFGFQTVWKQSASVSSIPVFVSSHELEEDTVELFLGRLEMFLRQQEMFLKQPNVRNIVSETTQMEEAQGGIIILGHHGISQKQRMQISDMLERHKNFSQGWPIIVVSLPDVIKFPSELRCLPAFSFSTIDDDDVFINQIAITLLQNFFSLSRCKPFKQTT